MCQLTCQERYPPIPLELYDLVDQPLVLDLHRHQRAREQGLPGQGDCKHLQRGTRRCSHPSLHCCKASKQYPPGLTSRWRSSGVEGTRSLMLLCSAGPDSALPSCLVLPRMLHDQSRLTNALRAAVSMADVLSGELGLTSPKIAPPACLCPSHRHTSLHICSRRCLLCHLGWYRQVAGPAKGRCDLSALMKAFPKQLCSCCCQKVQLHKLSLPPAHSAAFMRSCILNLLADSCSKHNRLLPD